MNLQPVDFKAVAAKGCFVYCYLREHDFTPYYVGVATRSDRPTSKQHSFHIPSDKTLIRVLRSGLTRDEASQWEVFFIAHYGRKDIGTGILRNLTNGGDGVIGRKFTDAERRACSARQIGTRASAKTLARMSAAQSGLSTPAKRAAGARRALADATAWTVRNGVDTDRYLALSYSQRDAYRARLRYGYEVDFAFNGLGDNETILSGRELAGIQKRRGAAAKYGIDVDFYLSLNGKQRAKIADRKRAGKSGADLTAGLVAA